jgi:SAM-dependent methyltransferase
MQNPNSNTYDPVAQAYAEKFYRELEGKPFDCQQLDALTGLMPEGGLLADLGCGPGHVGRYLADKGFKVLGLDVSECMLEQARRLNPGLCFEKADLLDLPSQPSCWDGAVAAYSLIHVPQDRLAAVLGRIAACLKPQAPLLASFHLGSGAYRSKELFGTPVCVDYYFYTSEEVQAAYQAAGFQVVSAQERDPYPEVEYQGRRTYVLGCKA